MPQNDPIPTAFLIAGEAVCLLAYEIVSEAGGTEWREAKMPDNQQELALLVGKHGYQVAEMQWSEVDFGKREWTIPALRSNPKREYIVPLPAAAMEILESLPRFTEGEYVFTTTAGRRSAKSEIEEEETARFFWAIKLLERAGQAGKIHIQGRRSSRSELLPVPEVDLFDRRIDVFGENGGSLAGAIEDDDGSLDLTQLATNHDRAQWVGLRFKRAEIEELRSAYRFVDPTAVPTFTTAQRNEDWADRAIIMHDQGMAWREAAEAIATSDKADSGYVEWVVRKIRNAPKRESRETI